MIMIDYAMRVATELQHQGHLSQASLILDNILDAYPTQPYALHLSGIITYQRGDINRGIQLIQQAIASHEEEALFHSNLGEMYRQLKLLDLSIQHGERAITLNCHSASAFSNLGIAYYDAEQYKKAEHCHQRALAIHPNFSRSLNNMGSLYKIYGKIREAIAFYQAAIQAEPNFIEPIINLGALLLQQQAFNEAYVYIKKALQLRPDNAHGYQLLSDIYYHQGKNNEALMQLDRALSIDPTLTNIHITKGTILMEMGKIPEAETQFSFLTQEKSPETRLLAYYSLTQLKKTEPHSENLQALLSIADNIHDIPPEKQPYLYFALGKSYDDLGEWTKAFEYFRQGCQLKRKSINYDAREQIKLTNRLIRTFTKENIEYLREFANPSALPIFIVGMPRAGTTLIEQILASHPKVHGAGELTYLLDLIEPDKLQSSNTYRLITQKYLIHLQYLSSNATHITDKMPQNFMVIGLIHALFPNAKIIHVKRNPLDTCLSCYTKLFNKGQYYSYDLTELGQYYQCYEVIMRHWRNTLPANAWLEVNYEHVIHDIETTAKQLVAYCDLNWDPACLTFYKSKRDIRTASFMQVRKPIYTSAANRWKNYASELTSLINLLSPNNKYDQNEALF